MELYCRTDPDVCAGCGAAITTGEVVVPTRDGRLLCIDCGAGMLLLLSGREIATPARQNKGRWEAMQGHPGFLGRGEG